MFTYATEIISSKPNKIYEEALKYIMMAVETIKSKNVSECDFIGQINFRLEWTLSQMIDPICANSLHHALEAFNYNLMFYEKARDQNSNRFHLAENARDNGDNFYYSWERFNRSDSPADKKEMERIRNIYIDSLDDYFSEYYELLPLL